MESKRKIILAVAGASGSIYAKMLAERIRELSDKPRELAMVFSTNAGDIWEYELGSTPGKEAERDGMTRIYENNDFHAPFASGSSTFDTMIICPASMGMLGRIANGVADDLITRAADVMLKERRKLILVPRETPYNLIHINNMKLLTEAGAVIMPATPSFYSRPKNIDELVLTVVDRILDQAGFDVETQRWGDE